MPVSTPTIPITKPITDAAEERRLLATLRSGWLTQGPETFAFERAVCEQIGAPHAVATNSATTALHIALVLIGVGPGDEVVLQSYTHIATANCVSYCGATPVFVDIRPDTYNLDEEGLEAAITAKTRAIVVVHQFGMPAELNAIDAIAQERGIPLLEDAACALGSSYMGNPVGSGSSFAVFSFHPRKVITTGEGGMLILADGDHARRARSLASHGESVLDVERHSSAAAIVEEYAEVGFNYRLTSLQAAVGIAQLEKLELILASRRRLADRYGELLREIEGVETPVKIEHAESNYQSYAVRISGGREERDRLIQEMRDAGIATRPGIPPIHHQPMYRPLVRQPLPQTDAVEASSLLLPLFPTMTEDEQDQVVERISTLVGVKA
jgi:dTDP-4-amino-4,6-dideoxygalactose transaminase